MSSSPDPNPSTQTRPSASDAASAKTPFPSGTLPVAVGLVLNGISAYAFFVIGGKHLGDTQFKPVNALWFATFALAPGFFLPLEQELGRALSHRVALGQGGRPLVRRVVQLGFVLAAVVAVTLIALIGPIGDHYFESDGATMVLCLLLAFVVYAPTHLARGICSGTGRFAGYGLLMGLEGVLRVVGAAVLALAGVHALGPFGLLVALAPLLGLVIVWRRHDLTTDDGPPASWSEVTPNLGWLLVGSVFAAMLVNAGPITANLLADSNERDLVSEFGYGVLLGRIPLFLFQAVQAALLPRLARLAAEGLLDEFKAGFRKLLVVVAAVALVGTVGALAVGPPILKRVFDAELDRQTLTMLALGSGCYMMALAVAQALIALHGHARVALGWTVGVAGFVAGTALGGPDTFRRVEIGLVVGSAVAMATFLASLRSKLASHPTPDAGSILQALTDRPLDGSA